MLERIALRRMLQYCTGSRSSLFSLSMLTSLSTLRASDSIRPTVKTPLCSNLQIRSMHDGIIGHVNNPRTRYMGKKQKKKRTKSYSFIDRARFRVQGGSGGRGSLSTHRLMRKHFIKPDGGHGGDGGSVIIVADPLTHSLEKSHPHITASDGGHGMGKDRHGARGRNRIMRVPVGVIVKRIVEENEEWDETTQTVRKIAMQEEYSEENDNREVMDEYDGKMEDMSLEQDEEVYEEEEENYEEEVYEEEEENYNEYANDENSSIESDMEDIADENGDNPFTVADRKAVVLADLNEPGAHVVVARGGMGGRGTTSFASKFGPLPDANTLIKRAIPKDGEVAFLELELKLIADVGLVGFPNAGKSSLLRAMSRATPAVAPYPFTTLHPLVGMIEYRDGLRIRAADIPGLIDGASQGKGKGHDFLRHIERTKALLYMVDAAGVDFRDPVSDLEILAKELSSYGDGSLMERRALVVANKLDLLDDVQIPDILSSINDTAIRLGIQFEDRVFGISAGVTGEGLSELSRAIRTVVTNVENDRQRELEEDPFWKPN